ncbi:MAG: uroporphyrinogen decarboxylase family protein [Eubacteriales bacterium]
MNAMKTYSRSSPRGRFMDTLRFVKPQDCYPKVEWAAWWDLTYARFVSEGLPATLNWEQSQTHFGLDILHCLYITGIGPGCPSPSRHGAEIITTEQEYEAIRPFLYQKQVADNCLSSARALKERHDKGEIIVRLWLDGFFWFPRTLLGIEGHLLAFYDNPELMHRINADLSDYYLSVLPALFEVLAPDYVGFAEDMSYNLGPMLSRGCFEEFLLPYYKKVIPLIKSYGVTCLADSDGDITDMIPWLKEAGIDGIYPLERQAGVDINHIRREYPDFIMLGGYDKMVMSQGEEAMRAEFERVYPVLKSGGYILSVDHQTPPGVSLENYYIYSRLLGEYCEKAAREG